MFSVAALKKQTTNCKLSVVSSNISLWFLCSSGGVVIPSMYRRSGAALVLSLGQPLVAIAVL